MREIQLTRGKVALVDDRDFEAMSHYKWHARKGVRTWYAEGHGHREDGAPTHLSMHRLIMGAPEGMQVDHIDGNGLNNTRENLRLCTRAENQFNRACSGGKSKYKGVSLHRNGKKWRAQIWFADKRVDLGLFIDEEDAARAYDEAARRLFGQFARLNFPLEQEQSALTGTETRP